MAVATLHVKAERRTVNGAWGAASDVFLAFRSRRSRPLASLTFCAPQHDADAGSRVLTERGKSSGQLSPEIGRGLSRGTAKVSDRGPDVEVRGRARS